MGSEFVQPEPSKSAPSDHAFGCVIEDVHVMPDECMSRADLRDEALLRRWEDDCQDRGRVCRG